MLDLLEISGCIITLDAMGCQKKVVEKIIDKKGDYIIGLKGNLEQLRLQHSGHMKHKQREVRTFGRYEIMAG